MGAFGSLSRKILESDLLGRARRELAIDWTGLPEPGRPAARFLIDDLELLAGRQDAAGWRKVVAAWAPGEAAQLLPWAVVHGAIAAPVVRHLHTDAICVVANAPDARASLATWLGREVPWLPFATPGPELARALQGVDGGAAVVGNLGLVAWGATEADVEAACMAIDGAAEAWLASRGVSTTPDVPALPRGDDDLHAMVRLRRGASSPRPAVLALDASLAALASRTDLETLVRAAGALEITAPWDAGVVAEPRAGQEPDGRGTGTPEPASHLVPGVGLVTAGPGADSARAAGAVAAHRLRVAATLLDAFGGFAPLPDGERERVAIGNEGSGVPAPGLRGRIYVVTGAASGIGRDVARHLAGLGASLALGDRTADGLELLADELEPLAGRPVTVAGDLTDEATIDRLVAATIRRFGGVDGAVLNVGVALPGEIRSLSAEDWRRSLDVNATSHFLLVRRLLPVLEEQGLGGSLVFIGSKNMFAPGAGFGAYSASKAALAQLARVVAIEAGPMGVRSNIVNPDNVFGGSALWSPELRAQRAAVYGINPEDLEAYYTKRNLMKVPITGEDVAKGVAFLLSDDALRTTACVLTVDGGVPGVFPR